jgi:hypothetical protein
MEPPSPIPAALIEALRRKSQQDAAALETPIPRKAFALAVRKELARPTPAPLPQKPITLTNTESEDL